MRVNVLTGVGRLKFFSERLWFLCWPLLTAGGCRPSVASQRQTLSQWRLFEVLVLLFNSYTQRCIIQELRGQRGRRGVWARGSCTGQKTWRAVGACGARRGIGSLDKLTVLDWLQGKVTDVGINFILFAPWQWRDEHSRLSCFNAADPLECRILWKCLNIIACCHIFRF